MDEKTGTGSPRGESAADPPLAPLIDHTLLAPDATARDVERLCGEAREHGFANVCVNGFWVEHCVRALAGSDVGVATVVGFPLGASSSEVKAFEAASVAAAGAVEIDMVQNVGALKLGDDELVLADVAAVVAAARERDARVKVILETCLLTDDEKVRACRLAVRAGANFVKTSTGFGAGGATVADVALMRASIGPDVGLKAAGGIRDRAHALALIRAGATRLGASASVALVS